MAHRFNNIYQFEWELGKGGFGTVFLAREEVSHCQVAIRQLNSQDADRQRVIVREPVTMNWASTLVA
jgi:hypothetical protein